MLIAITASGNLFSYHMMFSYNLSCKAFPLKDLDFAPCVVYFFCCASSCSITLKGKASVYLSEGTTNLPVVSRYRK